MANEVVSRRLNIYIDEVGAGQAIDKLEAKAKKLVDSIEKGTKAGRDMTKEMTELSKTKDKIQGLQDVVDGKIRPSFTQVSAIVKQLRNELRHMSEDAPGYASKFQKFTEVSAEFNRMKSNISGVRAAVKNMATDIKSVALGMTIGNGIEGVFNTVSRLASKIVTVNAELSDELANIEKTTGLTASQVQQVNAALEQMDTRTSNSKLRELASEAGKLGKSSVEDVRRFVEEADKINVALGEDLGEGAIVQLGKLSNIFKTDMINIASAINEIGAASEASESFQVDFLSRVAGIAPVAKLSADELLGYGAALESLGQTQEVSGTAINSFFIDFVKETEKFGKAAGFAKGELSKLLESQGTNQAFLTFLERLKAGSSSSQELLTKLQQLGIDGSRGANVFLTLANNIERVKNQQLIANKAIQSGSSVINEFNKRNNNLAAELEKAGKSIATYFANSGFTTFLTDLARGFNDLVGPSRNLLKEFEDQRVVVKKLETDTLPLIDTVERLTAKADSLGGVTKLSKEEQVELNKAIQTVGEIIPGAITEFDKYGKAISVNTDIARAFIELQKNILKERNREAINSYKSDLDAVKKEIKINQGLYDGLVKARDRDFERYGDKLLNFYNKVLPQQLQKVIDLQNRAAGLTGNIAQLSGEETDEQKRLREALAKGTGDTTTVTGGVGEEQAAALKKTADEIKKLQQELQKIAKEFDLSELTAFQKKIAEINNRFDELVVRAKGSRSLIDEANRLRQVGLDQAISSLLNKGVDTGQTVDVSGFVDKAEAISKKIEAAVAKRMKGTQDKDALDAAQRVLNIRNKVAELELGVLTTKGREQLKYKLALLDEEKAEIIRSKNLTTEELAVLDEQYRQKEKEAIKKFNDDQDKTLKEKLNKFVEYLGMLVSAFASFNSVLNESQNAQLENDRYANDQKKQNYQKLLDQKLISQKQYDAAITKLDKDQAEKEKKIRIDQFKRNKALSIAQATINTYEAATKALTLGPPAGPILAGLIAALGLVQVALIARQEPPSYGRGGQLDGPSHNSKEKGMPVTNTRTGEVQAYVEGGEGIVNKKTMADPRQYTVTGNSSQITSWLNANHGGVNWASGATASPKWIRAPQKRINVARMNESIEQVRMFANGGIMNSNSFSANATDSSATINPEQFQQLINVLQKVDARLNEPLIANIIYGVYELKQQRITAIRDAGTIN